MMGSKQSFLNSDQLRYLSDRKLKKYEIWLETKAQQTKEWYDRRYDLLLEIAMREGIE